VFAVDEAMEFVAVVEEDALWDDALEMAGETRRTGELLGDGDSQCVTV